MMPVANSARGYQRALLESKRKVIFKKTNTAPIPHNKGYTRKDFTQNPRTNEHNFSIHRKTGGAYCSYFKGRNSSAKFLSARFRAMLASSIIRSYPWKK